MPHLDVYGLDHSPWVQTVLLGLYEKGVSHTLTTVPPLSVFGRWGVMMPAARVDGGPWQLESAEILRRVGYDPVSAEDMAAIYGAWQGVTHRADRASRFWHAFSLVRDPHPSLPLRLRNHFLRSFAVLYFFLLIRFMVLARAQPDPDNFADQFLYWEQKLERSAGAYLGGNEPGILDMLLFGIIQCHCSNPVPPIATLQTDAKLTRMRSWIGAMQERFAGYDHLYSVAYFEPRSAAPRATTRLEQSAFWFGSVLTVALFPITVPLIAFFAIRVPRNGPQD